MMNLDPVQRQKYLYLPGTVWYAVDMGGELRGMSVKELAEFLDKKGA